MIAGNLPRPAGRKTSAFRRTPSRSVISTSLSRTILYLGWETFFIVCNSSLWPGSFDLDVVVDDHFAPALDFAQHELLVFGRSLVDHDFHEHFGERGFHLGA